MVAFIDDHRASYGVEPIYDVLPIAPSTYCEQKTRQADPTRLPARTQRDAQLRPEIERVWRATRRVYGAKKVWKELKREQIAVARCTVVRLMVELGLRGVVRGRRVRTTIPDAVAERPRDLVERNFQATRPNELWVNGWRGSTLNVCWNRSATYRWRSPRSNFTALTPLPWKWGHSHNELSGKLGSIHNFAGAPGNNHGDNNSADPLGDGGPAVQAGFVQPLSIAVAPDGIVYISDNRRRVRRVGPDGIITTFAGTGVAGFSWHSGPARLALKRRRDFPFFSLITSSLQFRQLAG